MNFMRRIDVSRLQRILVTTLGLDLREAEQFVALVRRSSDSG